MKRVITTLALVLTSCLFLWACGGVDEVKSSATDASVATISTTPHDVGTPANPRLADALLTANDFGAGWSQQAIQGATVADAYYCGAKYASPPIQAAASFTFVGPHGEEGRVVFEALADLLTADNASAAIEELRALHAACTDWIATDGDRRTEWHTESFGEATLGDEAVVERATTQFPGMPGRSASYGFAIREGSILLSIAVFGYSHTDPGVVDPGAEEATAIARQAYAKLVDVVGSNR